MSKTILIFSNQTFSLINFRRDLIIELISSGCRVICCAPKDSLAEEVKSKLNFIGADLDFYSLSRKNLNFFQDIKGLIQIRRILRKYKPDIVISYTPKAIIFSGLILRFFKNINFYPICTGVGYSFIDEKSLNRKILKYLVSLLYKITLKKTSLIFFQNSDDKKLFFDLKILQEGKKTFIINGSGVNLEHFTPEHLPSEPNFLMVSRLLKDKGVLEYFQAAEIVKKKFPNVKFHIAGGLDSNPACINANILKKYVQNKTVDYLGTVNPIKSLLKSCKFFVLPSYREGTPRAVLEAMATSRPIITTNVPGCRETVVNEKNGLLVPPRDVRSLADAMIKLINYDYNKINNMGKESLKIAIAKYDVKKVNRQILSNLNL